MDYYKQALKAITIVYSHNAAAPVLHTRLPIHSIVALFTPIDYGLTHIVDPSNTDIHSCLGCYDFRG